MENKRTKHLIVVIALLSLTSLALAYTVDVSIIDKTGITKTMPDVVGEWRGKDLRFCQERRCEKSWTLDELDPKAEEKVCPSCGGKLAMGALDEMNLLPADTEIKKRRYYREDGSVLHAAYVLSGKERASIHRPEQCLNGQGSKITKQFFYEIPIEGRSAPLQVKILELDQEQVAPNGAVQKYTSFYAYWFVGYKTQTASHYERMYYMAVDRIFRSEASRWAYLSVSGLRNEENDDYLEMLTAFVQKFYPETVIHP